MRKPRPTTVRVTTPPHRTSADRAARNDSNDRNAAAKARGDKARDDGNVDTNADADTKTDTDTKAATPRRARSKSDAPKSDGAKSDETTQGASGDASAAADQSETAQDGTAVVTADAIAVANPCCRSAGGDSFRDTSNRQGDRAACHRSRGDRRLRLARRRDGARR